MARKPSSQSIRKPKTAAPSTLDYALSNSSSPGREKKLTEKIRKNWVLPPDIVAQLETIRTKINVDTRGQYNKIVSHSQIVEASLMMAFDDPTQLYEVVDRLKRQAEADGYE